MFTRNRHELMTKKRFRTERERNESMTNIDIDQVKIVPSVQIKKERPQSGIVTSHYR